MKTTYVKILDSPFNVDFDTKYSSDAAFESHKIICLRDHGLENWTSDNLEDQIGDKKKSVITDEDREAKKEENGNIIYWLGPHLHDLPGRNLNITHPDTGLSTHITIGKLIDDYNDGLDKNNVRQAHFKFKFNKDDQENIMSYNDIKDYLSWDTNLYNGENWAFKKIIGRQWVYQGHPDYKDRSFNLWILWENGEETIEPLKKFAADVLVECVLYAKEKNLLETDGWKQFKRIIKREGLLEQLVKHARLASFWSKPKYKSGYKDLEDYEHAMRLNTEAGNNKWAKATKLKMD